MDASNRSEEEEWAHSWAQALRHGSPATQPPTVAQAGADLLSVLSLLGRLTADQQAQGPPSETHDAQRQAAPPQQPHSAFHSLPQAHAQWGPQPQQAEPADGDSVHKHLEAVSFWIQLYQIAHAGLKTALADAQRSFQPLPSQLTGLADVHAAVGGRQRGVGQQVGAAHMAQLQALLQGGLPAAGGGGRPQSHRQQSQPLNQHLLQLVLQQQASAVGVAGQAPPPQQQQQSVPPPQAQQGFYAERSLDRVAQAPMGFHAERSLERVAQQQQQQQGGGSGSGAFKAERSLERPGGDPDSVVGFGTDWSLDPPSDQSQEQLLRKRARRGEDSKVCSNCGTTSTPFWRKDRNSGLALCNACGLYASKNDHPRPVKLWGPGGPPSGVVPTPGIARPLGLPPSIGVGALAPSSGAGAGSTQAAAHLLTAQQYVAAALQDAAAAAAAAAQQQEQQDDSAAGAGAGQQAEGSALELAQLAEHAAAAALPAPHSAVQPDPALLEMSKAPAAGPGPAPVYGPQTLQEHTLVEERQGFRQHSPPHTRSVEPELPSPLPPQQQQQHAHQAQAAGEGAGASPGKREREPPCDERTQATETAAAKLAAAFAAAAAAAAAAASRSAEKHHAGQLAAEGADGA